MNAEKLDGLLVDYSLGAVLEDVAMLIEACAENDPAIRKSIAAYRSVADLARRAGDAPSPSLPAFPRQRLEQARYVRQSRRAVMWITAAAACVALGFFGRAPWNMPQPQRVPQIAQVSVPVVAAAEAQAAPAGDFWSPARWEAYAKQHAQMASAGAASGNSWNVKSLADIQRIGG